MSLTRFVVRSMLASYFVADGVKAATNPSPLIEEAEPLASGVASLADRFLPQSVAKRVPHDTATFVRIHGVVESAAAIMMALGICRRFAAGLLGVAYLPKALAARPRMKPLNDRRFLKELALLGGVGIAAMDTEGKPGVAWIANQHREQLARASAKLIDEKKAELTKASSQFVSDLSDKAQDVAHATKKQARTAMKAAEKAARDAGGAVAAHLAPKQ